MKKLLKLNKLKQATALLMVLTLVIGLVNLSAFSMKAKAAGTDEVQIVDENLRKVICNALNKEYTEGVAITEDEMAGLTELDASNTEVKDIRGLSYAVNLEKLNLSGTKIASMQRFDNVDVYELQALSKLKEINLSDCGKYATDKTASSWYTSFIDIVAPSITTLEKIDLSNNDIYGQVYLSSEYSYKSLKVLDLSHNRITALMNISSDTFPVIEKIDLSDNGIYLEESQDGYSGYIAAGFDKFDFSNQKNLAKIHDLYLQDATSETISISSKNYTPDENNIIDLGDVYTDNISFVLKGETCSMSTAKAEINGEKYTVVCSYSNDFSADYTKVTLSDLREGENELKISVYHMNGDSMEYTLKYNKKTIPVSDGENSAGIVDPVMYTYIMGKLGKTDYTYVITKDDMASLKGTVNIRNVGNIEGIQYATSITGLQLYGTYDDVSYVNDLTKLTSLVLVSENVNKMPDITKMTALKSLTLALGSSDEWSVENQTKLTRLTLGNSNIESKVVFPKGTSELKNISRIGIYGNGVSSITEKVNYTKSSGIIINLYNSEALNDISGISGNPYVQLNVTGKIGIDFSTLSNVDKLELKLDNITNNATLNSFGENVKLTSYSKTGGEGINDSLLLESASDTLETAMFKNNAIKEIPDGLYKCTLLNKLTIDSCDITNISDEIANLKELQTLELKSTKLTDLPEALGELKQVKTLDIYNNIFDGLPSAIFNMTGIESISGNYSELKSINGEWDKLTNLKTLSFEMCYIQELPSNLNKATALVSIDLINNPLSSIDDDAFDGLANLTSVRLGNYFKSNLSLSAGIEYEMTDENAITAWNKLNERGVYTSLQGTITLSQLKCIKTSVGDIYYKIHTDNQEKTIYVPSTTKEFELTPIAAKEDTEIVVNGKNVKSGEKVTISDLSIGNNVITITSKNNSTVLLNSEPKTITYSLNVFVGDFVDEKDFPLDKHTYLIEGQILKQYDSTGSMAASYMGEQFKVKYINGKYAVDLSVNSNSWIPLLRYLDEDTGMYVNAQKISEDNVNNSAVWRLYTNDINKPLYISPYVVPMGYSPICRIIFDKNKITDITDTLPSVDTTDLNIAINQALEITDKHNIYTDDTYSALTKALEAAQKVSEDKLASQEEVDEALAALNSAINGLVIDEKKLADKTALKSVIDEASAIEKGNHTDAAWNALTEAIADAKAVMDNQNALQSEVDLAAKALKSAITIFNNSGDASQLDKNNLEDGVYSIYADMIKMDRANKSMADNAINHTVKLEIKNGEYYITLDFRGITIENRFGYLKNLSYYTDGYVYGQNGTIEGTLEAAEVLSTQKDTDGNDVIDQYNDKNSLYPDIVRIKLVKQAIADADGYVPLHVFVPIMEAIAEGNGDQDVLMKLDWTSLKKTTEDDDSFKPQDPVEQSPAVDITDAATGVKVRADKGVFEEGVQLVVTPITSGDVYNKAVNSLTEVGKKFRLYEVHFVNAQGQEVQPNGTVTVYYPIPEGYDVNNLVLYRINEDGTKTLVKGVVEDGYYKVVTKSFSTYALVEKGSTITDSENTAMIAGSNVKTGDSNNFVLWIMLLCISLGAGAVTVAGKRRKLKGE